MIPPTQGPRLRNAAATRAAILASARRHWARDSYENVGLREIAGDAGVDPALIARYFGSKEQLFKEAVRGDDQHVMQGVAREGLAAHLAALTLDEQGADSADQIAKIDRLLILLRSVSSPKASEIIADVIDADILQPIADALGGAHAEARASLCLAVLMGTAILRSAMTVDSLRGADAEFLRGRLHALFAAAMAG